MFSYSQNFGTGGLPAQTGVIKFKIWMPKFQEDFYLPMWSISPSNFTVLTASLYTVIRVRFLPSNFSKRLDKYLSKMDDFSWCPIFLIVQCFMPI